MRNTHDATIRLADPVNLHSNFDVRAQIVEAGTAYEVPTEADVQEDANEDDDNSDSAPENDTPDEQQHLSESDEDVSGVGEGKHYGSSHNDDEDDNEKSDSDELYVDDQSDKEYTQEGQEDDADDTSGPDYELSEEELILDDDVAFSSEKDVSGPDESMQEGNQLAQRLLVKGQSKLALKMF